MALSPRLLRPRASGISAVAVASGLSQVTAVSGNYITIQLEGRWTTLAIPSLPVGSSKQVVVSLVQDAFSQCLVSWPANVTWAGGTAPTLQTTGFGVDVVSLVTTDGGVTWAGQLVSSTAGATALFHPRNMMNLAGLWDASDSRNVILSGSAVNTFLDTSGFGRDFYQATSASQPTFTPNAVNGLSGITFNGTSNFLETALSPAIYGRQVHLIVAKTGSAGRTPALSNASSPEAIVFQNATSSPVLRWGMWRTSTSMQSTTASSSANAVYIIVGDFNGSSSSLRVNGVQVVSGTVGTGATGALRLGRNISTDYYAGISCEVALISGDPATGDIAKWETYAASKWGVSL